MFHTDERAVPVVGIRRILTTPRAGAGSLNDIGRRPSRAWERRREHGKDIFHRAA